jgi:two-component system response regulator FixJ
MPGKRCVHIIDDEAKIRDSLAVLLSTAGIKSRAYASAEEYLASVPLSEPACVILDNQLPGLSGMELLKRIADAASNTAVIMITGYGDVPTAVSAMKAGAFHFVQKPFDAEALLNIVEETLARADEVRDLQAELQEFRTRCVLLTQHEAGALKIEGQEFAICSYSDVPRAGDALAVLSPREMEIARCVAAGYQAKAIAQRLRISYYTVRVHVGRIYCKLGLHKQTELASWISANYGRQRIDD